MGYNRDMQPSKIGLIIVAIICPPVAVLIQNNAIDNDFFINLLLTLLAWLPGMLHALWVICKKPSGNEYLEPLTRPVSHV